MNKYDLLEAMGGIREEYILDAADLKNDQTVPDSPLDNNHTGQPEQVHVNEQETGRGSQKSEQFHNGCLSVFILKTNV